MWSPYLFQSTAFQKEKCKRLSSVADWWKSGKVDRSSSPCTLFPYSSRVRTARYPLRGSLVHLAKMADITKWRGTYTSRCKWTYLKGFCRSNYGYIDTVGKQLIYYIDHLHLPLSWWMRYTRCTACRRSLRSREVHHHGPRKWIWRLLPIGCQKNGWRTLATMVLVLYRYKAFRY